jgi:hypothetical protein
LNRIYELIKNHPLAIGLAAGLMVALLLNISRSSGVVISGLIALIGVVLSYRHKADSDFRIEVMRLAVTAGVEAFKSDRQYHYDTQLRHFPMSYYIFFHYNYLNSVAYRTNTASGVEEFKTSINNLNSEHESILQVLHDGEWYKAMRTPFTEEEYLKGKIIF